MVTKLKGKNRILTYSALLSFVLGASCAPSPEPSEPKTEERRPIIDMHLHAYTTLEGVRATPGVPGKERLSSSPQIHLEKTLEALEKYNIVKAVVSGRLEAVEAWRKAAPDRVIGAVAFPRMESSYYPDLERLRELHGAGDLGVVGEVTAQYAGLRPTDPRLGAYFSLAEELDIPVGVHTGLGEPGSPNFRVTLGNPAFLEEVIVLHPRLRLYIMHAGYPYLQETIAIMRYYPQVYADLAFIKPWGTPLEEFHAYLEALIRGVLETASCSAQIRWSGRKESP